MTHPPVYYTVRSVVRFTFWFTVFVAILYATSILLGGIGNALSGPPDCDVRITPDGQWRADGPVDLATCAHPKGIWLRADGSWELWDELVDGPRPLGK